MSGETILLDPTKAYQEVLGVGAALTEAACYMFNQLLPQVREQLFHELYHPSEMGFGVCRTCIGSSDYSTVAYSYDDGDVDPELLRFSIDHERAYVLPMLRLARKMNPELYVFGAPWSPPGWMKSNGSMVGGSMRKHSLAMYADYFVKYLKAYALEGVVVDAVTPQNEVDTDQDGRMPACLWAQEHEIEFVGKHLGPALEKNQLATKIWILDHNWNLWGRATCELEDPDVNRYVEGIAWHVYGGKDSAMTAYHLLASQKYEIAALLTTVTEDFDRIHELFPRLLERRSQLAGTLSGGEQQMVAMGRALMSRPRLLLMDEPSMGLSPALVLQNFQIIKTIHASGVAVLMVEQNATMALSIADRGYVLSTGEIVLEGRAADLLQDEDLKRAYLGR